MRVLLLTVSLERWLNRLILAKVVFWKIGKGLGEGFVVFTCGNKW